MNLIKKVSFVSGAVLLALTLQGCGQKATSCTDEAMISDVENYIKAYVAKDVRGPSLMEQGFDVKLSSAVKTVDYSKKTGISTCRTEGEFKYGDKTFTHEVIFKAQPTHNAEQPASTAPVVNMRAIQATLGIVE